MTIPKTRIFIPHNRDCAGVRHTRSGDWPNPWALGCDMEDTHMTSMWHPGKPKNTGARLRFAYLMFRCNDGGCPAIGGIRIKDAERALFGGKP